MYIPYNLAWVSFKIFSFVLFTHYMRQAPHHLGHWPGMIYFLLEIFLIVSHSM